MKEVDAIRRHSLRSRLLFSVEPACSEDCHVGAVEAIGIGVSLVLLAAEDEQRLVRCLVNILLALGTVLGCLGAAQDVEA